MSQYNTPPLVDNAGRGATDLALAPFLPTMDQLGDSNPSASADTVGSTAALSTNEGSMSLHARAETTGLEQHATKNKHKAYLYTCRKGFTKLSALRRHIEESTLAREHRCPLCDHKCKRVCQVEQHLRHIHKKKKDEIKRLLTAQKSEPRQEPQQLETASNAAPTPGLLVAQAGHPVLNPIGAWTGPITFSATAPLCARPGASSAFLPALPVLGPGLVTVTPAFTPQSFAMQGPDLPAYYSAYSVDAMPAPTGSFLNPALAGPGYPVGPLEGTNNLSNATPAPVSVNLSDGFGMPDLGNFAMDFSAFDLNTFGI